MTVIETKLLKPVAQATVPLRKEPINLLEFFQDRKGPYVYNSFRNRFDLEVSAQAASGRPYVASLLKEKTYDQDIRQELPEHHLSTLEDIAGFIEAQPEGKEGFLLTNDCANIFYVAGKNDEVFAVSVGWDSGNRRWRVVDWLLGESDCWVADDRVLCPGRAAL